MPEIAEAPPVTAPVTAPPTAQPPISMSFVDKVAAAADKPKVETSKPSEKPNEQKPPDLKETAKVDKPVKPATPPNEVKPADNKADKRVVDDPDSRIEWKTAPEQFRKSHEKTLARLKELESKSSPKADELPEYKELSAKVAAKEKEYAELKAEADALKETIRYVDYEKSPEFQDKFHKPWVSAYQEGVSEFIDLSVPNEDGSTRKATKEEFDDIVTDPKLDSAIDKAEKLFQNATRANQALEHRRKFIAASRAMEAAKAEYRTKGAEMEKQTAAQRSEMEKQEQSLWENHNKEWTEKNPQWTKADEGDDEGAKKLELGYKAADMAFADTSHLTPEKRAKLFADTRNRAAAFGHVAYKLEKASARVAELEEKLKAFEESEPGKGELKKDAPVTEETFAQKLAKAAR